MQLEPDLIRHHRVERGLTQEQLARKAGYNTRTIQRAEAGEPVQSTIAAHIAQALSVRLDQILPRREHKEERLPSTEVDQVILLPCTSGRRLYSDLLGTTLLEVEKDFEPGPEHRETVSRFARFIEDSWPSPFVGFQERPPHKPTESVAFEMMIQAKEVIDALQSEGLHLLLGSYRALHGRLHFDEFGETWTSPTERRVYDKLLIVLTDRPEVSLTRQPADHEYRDIPF